MSKRAFAFEQREKKICLRCGEMKTLADFYSDRSKKNGKSSCCLICARKSSSKWNNEHTEIVKKNHAAYYATHLDKAKAASRNWAKNNPEKTYLSHKKWRDKNPDKNTLELTRQWCKNNPEKVKEMHRKWELANPERVKIIRHRKYLKLISDPTRKLSRNVSCQIWQSIRQAKNGHHWESLVGYTVDQLKAHLEKLFKPGMNWENYGLWHNDHKIPISAFNFETPEDIDFKRCWALKNLRPMWGPDNIRKGAKLNKPFQPSLAMAI